MSEPGDLMEVSIERRAPQVRCYQCGSATVRALCHHCWRPGCARHVVSVPGWTDRLLSSEGSGPGLARTRAVHCSDCDHTAAGHRLALGLTGAAAVAAGVITIWLNLVAGAALIVAGAAVAGWAYQDLRRHAAKAQASLPLLVHPKADTVRLAEKLRARITLGADGTYSTDPGPVDGQLTAVLVLGRADRDRLTHYLRKHPSGSGRDVSFTAGRLVLRSHADVPGVPDLPGPVVALDGSTGSLPVFRAEEPHASSSWTLQRTYQVPADPDRRATVIWITPSFVPGSDRQAIELDIGWVKAGRDDKPLSLDVVDLLILRFPAAWGKVQQVSERAIQGGGPADAAGSARGWVQWRQVTPTEDQRAARQLTLMIRFERAIDTTRPDENMISGRVEATLNGTLSGIEGVGWYGALGRRRSLVGTSIKTRVEADFTLSLASIRYQDIQIAPDRTAQDGDDSGQVEEFVVIPNADTVIELTNALSEQGYYLKRVIENPPRSGGRANHVQRFWDIAGRRYDRVYPMDFHLVLTGEEIHRGDIRPERGTTKVQIVVQGACTDDSMRDRIDEEWKALRALTEATLGRPGFGIREPSGPAARPGSASTGPAPPSARLLRRLGKLDEALVDGRITREEYGEMRARAMEELGGS